MFNTPFLDNMYGSILDKTGTISPVIAMEASFPGPPAKSDIFLRQIRWSTCWVRLTQEVSGSLMCGGSTSKAVTGAALSTTTSRLGKRGAGEDTVITFLTSWKPPRLSLERVKPPLELEAVDVEQQQSLKRRNAVTVKKRR